jgi:hypothetical protein
MSAPQPAETFHPAEYIRDELLKRGWTTDDLVLKHAGGDWRALMSLNLYMCVQSPGLLFSDDLIGVLADGFDTSHDYWLKLDEQWRRAPERSEKVDMPDAIFGGVSHGSLVVSPPPLPREE